MTKLPTYRQLGKFLLIASGMLGLLMLGFYFYYCPRLNKGLTAFVLFHPPKDHSDHGPLSIHGIEGQRYKVTMPSSRDAKGQPVVLDCRLFKVNPEKGVVFFSQGVGSSISALADPFKVSTLLDAGYSVFLYDQQGYGLSTGSCDIDCVMPNTVAAYDFLTNDLKYKPAEVIGYGESFGGGVTSELRKVRPLKKIILESTFVSPKRWADDQATFTTIYPDFLFMDPSFDNLAMLKGEHPPVLLVVAALDKSMPATHAEDLIKGAVEPFQSVSLPNSGHAHINVADRTMFHEAVAGFLDRAVPWQVP